MNQPQAQAIDLNVLPGLLVEWRSLKVGDQIKASPLLMYDFGETWADAMKAHILAAEPEIRKLGPDRYPATAPDSLTGRWQCYNAFDYDWEELQSARPMIRKLVEIFIQLYDLTPAENYFMQSWCNAFRHGEYIKWHAHCPEPKREYPCANIFHGGAVETQTFYRFADNQIEGFKNIPGRITIFSNLLPHFVPKYQGRDTRVTQAIDFFPEGSPSITAPKQHQWRQL